MLAEILFVVACLLGALAIRSLIPLLAAARIPASLLAGGLGLAFLQFASRGTVSPESDGSATFWRLSDRIADAGQRWSQTLVEWPGVLIAVVFAGLLLAKTNGDSQANTSDPSEADGRIDFKAVGRQGLMVWIIVLGQTAVGLWMTWLVIQPMSNLPNATAMLVETGFAGGHGTAAAMGSVFEHPTIDFPAGRDLGVLMATAGLAYGLVSGIVWINLAIWRRWYVPTEPDQSESPQNVVSESTAALAPGPAMGKPRVDGNIVDPLLLQVLWLMLAFGIGIALQQAVAWGGAELEQWWTSSGLEADASPLDDVSPVAGDQTVDAASPAGDKVLRETLTLSSMLGSFPLFIYTLFGGAIVRWGLKLAGQSNRIDSDTIARLVGTAMDVLVVAAVATLNLTAVASLWLPLLCLFLGGAIWSTLCLLVLSKRILPEKVWFPLGLINYGMSTGTTATGFVLLRVVDPNLKSGAGEDYALAAPLSAPFIGGGMLTVALPLLVLQRVSIAVSTLSLTAVVVALVVLGIAIKRKHDA